MKNVFFLFLTLLFFGCGNLSNVEPFDNLSNNTVHVIGHGGNGFQSVFDPFNPLPSNSKESIEEALEIEDIKGVEIDVQLSADSVLIAFHDYELENMTDLSGCIAEKNASEIIGQPYRNGLGLFHDEKIISLEEVLNLISDHDIEIHIDAKLNNICAKNDGYQRYKLFFNILEQLIKEKNFAADKIIIISEYEPFLDYIKENSTIRVVKDGPGISAEAALLYADKGYFGVSVNANQINREQIGIFHGQKLRVILFGGKSRSGLIRSLGKNPDYIQANNPERLVNLIRNWHEENPS